MGRIKTRIRKNGYRRDNKLLALKVIILLAVPFSTYNFLLSVNVSRETLQLLAQIDDRPAITGNSKRASLENPPEISNIMPGNTKLTTANTSTTNGQCEELLQFYTLPRLENIEMDAHIASAMIEKNPISGIETTLENTLCHKQGRFRNIQADSSVLTPNSILTGNQWNVSDTTLLSDWALKLMYLTVHDVLHSPARSELQFRKTCPMEIQQALPSFDYKCPDAKFLITSFPSIGMGASIRLSVVTYFQLAMNTNRIPLFIRNVPVGPNFLRIKSGLFSCPRDDPQCIFLPMSPCVVSYSDITNARVLDRAETRKSMRTSTLPSEIDSQRVVIIEDQITGSPLVSTDRFMQLVQTHLMVLIDDWKSKEEDTVLTLSTPSSRGRELQQKVDFLQAAAKLVVKDGVTDVSPSYQSHSTDYEYIRGSDVMSHVLMLYLLRPNTRTRHILKAQLENVFERPNRRHPLSFNASFSTVTMQRIIGLPIRGSDKCNKESTCLPFSKYMKLANETFWGSVATKTTREWNPSQKHSMEPNAASMQAKQGYIILTTEDEKIFQQQFHYQNRSDFPFEIIVNEADSFQGTGLPKLFGSKADDVMISSLLALQMQLHADDVYGNCCSNFHMMLFDLVRLGCGVNPTVRRGTCLQETSDYRVCCSWRNEAGCDAIREEHNQQKIKGF